MPTTHPLREPAIVETALNRPSLLRRMAVNRRYTREQLRLLREMNTRDLALQIRSVNRHLVDAREDVLCGVGKWHQ